MNKQDKKMLLKCTVACLTCSNNALIALYLACQDLYFSRVLHREIIKRKYDFNCYAMYYAHITQLNDNDLLILYATVCRCMKARRVFAYE